MLKLVCETCYCGFDSLTCPDCDGGFKTVPEDTIVYVNVYSITRHYGGPEEGGWYYDRAECLEVYPVKNKNSQLLKEQLEEEYKELAYGDISSVLGGRDIAVYIEEKPKQSEELERPMYE